MQNINRRTFFGSAQKLSYMVASLRKLLLFTFMLLGTFTSRAADDDLITNPITVQMDKAGTLCDKIESAKKYLVTKLKIVGEINGTDLRFIREMAGSDVDGESTPGKLSVLDLEEAKIVEGGDCYYQKDKDDDYFYTSKDVIGDYAFRFCESLTEVTIPSSVTALGEEAFRGCTGLYGMDIPSNVTSIGEEAFNDCSGLHYAYISSSVTEINDFTFQYCTSLDQVSIPSGVTKIGEAAFYNCTSLPRVTIPLSVTSIAEEAFAECRSLESIYVNWETPIAVPASVFDGVDKSKCTLFVPKGTAQNYKQTDVWGDFKNIEEYEAAGVDELPITTKVKEISRYSIDGKQMSAPTKGLNIVTYSNGRTKKVIVQ